MSYDLIVFDPEAPPRDREEFMGWIGETMESLDSGESDDPAIATPLLQTWFHEMILEFPPLNGPLAVPLDSHPTVADYFISPSLICVNFQWPHAEKAAAATFRVAEKHGVGLYNASGDDDYIWFPQPDGRFLSLEDFAAGKATSDYAEDMRLSALQALEFYHGVMKKIREDGGNPG